MPGESVPPEVLQAFGMSGATCRPIQSGRVNEHWELIRLDQKFVLRRYLDARSGAAIRFEHAALVHAASKGWPVARPVLATSGETFVVFADRRYSLFPFLNGEPPALGSRAHQRVVGSLLGRFIGNMEGSWVEGQRDGFGRIWELDLFVRPWGADSFNQLLGRFGAEYAELARVIRTHRYRNLRQLARLGYGDLPVTFVHGDFQRDNLLFSGPELNGLLDFDSCRLDSAVVDLAGSIWLNCLEPPDYDAIDIDGARALTEGFVRHRRLAPEEAAMIPELVRGQMLWFLAFRLGQWAAGDGLAVASIARTCERRFPALDAVGPRLASAMAGGG